MTTRKLFPLLFTILIFAGCSKNDATTGLGSNNNYNFQGVGASANDFLSASKYNSIKIEIQYMPGYQPDAAAINNLTTFLGTLLNKPGGITVVQTQIAASGNAVLSLNDIATIEKNNRTVYTSGSQLGVYFLYTNGGYTDANALGIAFRNTSMAMFGKTVHDHSGGIGQVSRTKLETTVLDHEFGHLLGLVDLGTPMQTVHKDAAHGAHCDNSNCLMYFQSETTSITGMLLTGDIPGLDANCKADLRANGGK
jgi:hypothetical protein